MVAWAEGRCSMFQVFLGAQQVGTAFIVSGPRATTACDDGLEKGRRGVIATDAATLLRRARGQHLQLSARQLSSRADVVAAEGRDACEHRPAKQRCEATTGPLGYGGVSQRGRPACRLREGTSVRYACPVSFLSCRRNPGSPGYVCRRAATLAQCHLDGAPV